MSEVEQEFVRAAMAKLAQDLIGALWELPGFQHTKGNSVVEDVLDLARRLRARQREEGDVDTRIIGHSLNQIRYIIQQDWMWTTELQRHYELAMASLRATPQREGEREPVAWMTKEHHDKYGWVMGHLFRQHHLAEEWREFVEEYEDHINDIRVVPLYTEPPAEREQEYAPECHFTSERHPSRRGIGYGELGEIPMCASCLAQYAEARKPIDPTELKTHGPEEAVVRATPDTEEDET